MVEIAQKKRKGKGFTGKRNENVDDEGEEDYTIGVVSDEEVEKAQGRLREAKKYLADLTRDSKRSKKQEQAEEGDENLYDLPVGIDAEEIDKEIIASRLQKDTLISRGRAFENVALSYKDGQYTKLNCNMPDGRVPTGCVFSPDSKVVYLIGKGRSLYQYAVEASRLRKVHTFKGIGPAADIDSFTSLAVSHCGTFVVAGSNSGKIVVWSVKPTSGSGSGSGSDKKKMDNTNSSKSSENITSYTYRQLNVLTQHRGAVLALSFTRDDLTFYSSSADRTVKIWSIEGGTEALYIDTLYGHQDGVSSLAALNRESCVTVGSRDRTARLWKISEETQLVFRGPESAGGSQDVISIIEDGAFVTGTDLGAISLWNTRRKKPLVTVHSAHQGQRPIGALAALPYTDLVASGSADGQLHLWRAAPNSSELTCIQSIKLDGFINSLAWNDNGTVLAVAVGREPRLGRWETDKSVKNQLQIFKFKKHLNE